jgi:hypothetical protein
MVTAGDDREPHVVTHDPDGNSLSLTEAPSS